MGNSVILLTHVDELLDVSDGKVPEDGGVVEVGQPGHVLAHVKLGRIDLWRKKVLKSVSEPLERDHVAGYTRNRL